MPELGVELPLEVSADEASLLSAIKLWEEAILSLGQAAEFAGYSERAFIEILMHRRVPLLRYPAEDLGWESISALGSS